MRTIVLNWYDHCSELVLPLFSCRMLQQSNCCMINDQEDYFMMYCLLAGLQDGPCNSDLSHCFRHLPVGVSHPNKCGGHSILSHGHDRPSVPWTCQAVLAERPQNAQLLHHPLLSTEARPGLAALPAFIPPLLLIPMLEKALHQAHHALRWPHLPARGLRMFTLYSSLMHTRSLWTWICLLQACSVTTDLMHAHLCWLPWQLLHSCCRCSDSLNAHGSS